MKAAREQRDREFRRALLLVLFEWARTSATRSIPGNVLIDQANSVMHLGSRIEDDDEALGLCRDLVNAGMATEARNGERRRGQAFGPGFVKFEITDRGTQLKLQAIAPHPLIDDDRVE